MNEIENKYMDIFIRKAMLQDADDIMKIIVERSKWLKDIRVQQWESFFERDLSYYIEKINKGIVYIVLIKEEICGTFVLQLSDKYWNDDNDAMYIHHFAVKNGCNGLGKYIIKYIKEIVKSEKRNYIRLDHVQENEKLGFYYENLGFLVKGELYDGMYHCLLRELKV